MGRSGLAVVAAVLVLATGCASSATGGHGAMGAGSAPGSTDVPTSSVGAPPAGSSGTSSVASSPVPSATSLSCAPGSVTVTGAPFCYPLPRGFTDVSEQTNYGQGWTYRTLVSVGGHDLIEVLASIYSTDTDTLDDAKLRVLYDGAGLLEKGKLGFTSVSSVQFTKVDGARAFVQDGTYSSGVISHDLRIYTGRTIVFISCQSLTRTAAVQAACSDVVGAIQLVRT